MIRVFSLFQKIHTHTLTSYHPVQHSQPKSQADKAMYAPLLNDDVYQMHSSSDPGRSLRPAVWPLSMQTPRKGIFFPSISSINYPYPIYGHPHLTAQIIQGMRSDTIYLLRHHDPARGRRPRLGWYQCRLFTSGSTTKLIGYTKPGISSPTSSPHTPSPTTCPAWPRFGHRPPTTSSPTPPSSTVSRSTPALRAAGRQCMDSYEATIQ